MRSNNLADRNVSLLLIQGVTQINDRLGEVEMSREAVREGRGRWMKERGFFVPPWQADVRTGHSTMCSQALKYQDCNGFWCPGVFPPFRNLRTHYGIHFHPWWGGMRCLDRIRTAWITLYPDGLQTLALT